MIGKNAIGFIVKSPVKVSNAEKLQVTFCCEEPFSKGFANSTIYKNVTAASDCNFTGTTEF